MLGDANRALRLLGSTSDKAACKEDSAGKDVSKGTELSSPKLSVLPR